MIGEKLICSKYTNTCHGWSSFLVDFTDTENSRGMVRFRIQICREAFYILYILYFQFYAHSTTSIQFLLVCKRVLPLFQAVPLSLVPSMILVLPIPIWISLSSQLFSHFEKELLILSTFNIVSFPGHIYFPLSLSLSIYLALVLSLHYEMQSYFVPFLALNAEQPTFA